MVEVVCVGLSVLIVVFLCRIGAKDMSLAPRVAQLSQSLDALLPADLGLSRQTRVEEAEDRSKFFHWEDEDTPHITEDMDIDKDRWVK